MALRRVDNMAPAHGRRVDYCRFLSTLFTQCAEERALSGGQEVEARARSPRSRANTLVKDITAKSGQLLYALERCTDVVLSQIGIRSDRVHFSVSRFHARLPLSGGVCAQPADPP